MSKVIFDPPEKRLLLREAIRGELTKATLEDGNTRLSTSDREAFCDERALGRYLRARKGSVGKAKALLLNTLDWRGKMKLHGSHPFATSEFPNEIKSGKMYIAGNDTQGRSVMITRKKSDGFDGDHEQYMRHLAFVLDTACRAMKNNQESWVWIMDMRGYSRANSPPLNVSLATLRILADCYPERLHRVLMVDAPSVFSFLWSALSFALDPVTRHKVVFLSSSEWRKKVEASRGAGLVGQGGGIGKEGETKGEALDSYEEYLGFYDKAYNMEEYMKLLASVGWS